MKRSVHSTRARFIQVIILLALVTPVLLSLSKEDKKQNTPPFLASVDKVVEDQMAKQEIYGCAVGVVQNGNIVHVKAYGHHDKLRTKPFSVNTIFRWASVSKPLTAVAAFKAIETKKMALDDKVTKHVSYWPSTGNKDDVTIRNLLNNRSGVNHYTNIKKANYKSKNNFNAKQCVEVFSSAALDFDPGTQYNYTTFGFNLLGATVEEATNTPFETYVKNNIANKAGMTSLTAYPSDPGGFEKDCNGAIVNRTEGSVEWKLPGGGWGSNITDFTRFMQGLINGTFLSNTSALWQSVSNNNNYCFGTIRDALKGETYVWHNGAHNDVSTYMGFFPASKLGVVVIINADAYVSEGRMAKKIQALFGKDWNIDDLPVNYCGKNLNCGDNMVGVWRKNNTAEKTIIRRGYSTEEFNAEWKWLLDKGYYCSDLDTYTKGNARIWDGIFKKTNKKSALIRNYNHNDFNTKWKELSNKGYRLVDVETYMDGTTRKWAGAFLEMNGGYALHREMSHDEMHDKWSEYSKKGLKLVDIERYGNKWAGVWIAGDGNVAMYRNFETTDFRDKRREMNDNGWRLIDVDTYMDGGKRKWSGLWEKSPTPEHYIYGYDHCEWLTNYHNKYDNEGYELMDMESW
ncbi:MAG: serine hydrolase [Chitinophagaceae bacterium]|nr:serine hydrolase [Chitinophagaceae bacterium]